MRHAYVQDPCFLRQGSASLTDQIIKSQKGLDSFTLYTFKINLTVNLVFEHLLDILYDNVDVINRYRCSLFTNPLMRVRF